MQYSPWPLLFISGFHHKCLVHKFHTLKSLRKLYAWYGIINALWTSFFLYGSIWKDVLCCSIMLQLHQLTSETIPLKPLFHKKRVLTHTVYLLFPWWFLWVAFLWVWIFFTMLTAQISTLFISDTQTLCDYSNFKSLYKIYESYFALKFTNFNTQIIQLFIKPHENEKENVLLIHL